MSGRRPWTVAAGGLAVVVRLTPRGGRDAIDGIEQRADGQSVLKVRVRAAASEGGANRALTALIGPCARYPTARRDSHIRRQRPHQAADRRGPWPNARRRAGEDRRRELRSFAMTARIIDGKAIAAELCGLVADEVKRLQEQHGVTPGLAVVLVGNNPASESYVGNKAKTTVRPACGRSITACRRARARPSCWRWCKSSMPTRRCTASWCNCRCRSRSTPSRC